MREREAGADMGRELRAVAARAEQENRRQYDVGWHRLHAAERMAFRKCALLEGQQFLKAIEEIIGLRIVLPPPQRVGGHRIGAWRAAKPEIDAAGKQLRLRGFADASSRSEDGDIANPERMVLEKALQAIDAINETAQLSPIEKEILKEALIRAAINDVAWSAAFVSAVMRQAGMSNAEFEFSESHNTYIYKAFRASLAEASRTLAEGFYRACPLSSARPRLGDLVCYHRHQKQHGSKSAARIREMIVDDIATSAPTESIYKSHCDVVAHVDAKAGRVYVVGGNVQQAVSIKKLVLNKRGGTLAQIQPDGCRVDGPWTFPKADPGKPVAPHYSDECSLNRKHWFVLLQAR